MDFARKTYIHSYIHMGRLLPWIVVTTSIAAVLFLILVYVADGAAYGGGGGDDEEELVPGIEVPGRVATGFGVCNGPRRLPPCDEGQDPAHVWCDMPPSSSTHGHQEEEEKKEMTSKKKNLLGDGGGGQKEVPVVVGGAGLKLNLKHRAAHPSQKPANSRDSLFQSLQRDIARTKGFGKRIIGDSNPSSAAASLQVMTSAVTATPQENKTKEQQQQQGPAEEKEISTPVALLEFEATVESGATVGSGEYFMDIFVGTPPHHIPVVIDTGSDLTWIQCNPCEHCYSQEAPLFEPQASESYKHVPCESHHCLLVNPFYNTSKCGARSAEDEDNHHQTGGGHCDYFYWYGDHSNTTGDFASETFTVNVSDGHALQIENVMFGCGHNNEGLFQGAGGLLGLGQGEISFASQVASVYGNVFSYCLVDRDNPLSVTSTLMFGQDTVLSTVPDLQFTPFVKNPFVDTFYYVNVSTIVVGGELVSIPSSAWAIDSEGGGGGGTIIDSGTTLTYFTEPAYQATRTAFRSKISLPEATTPMDPLDLCYNTSGNPNPSLPDFAIVFGNGAVWQLPMTNVFIQPDPDEEIICLAILGCPASTLSIIGNFQQQNFHMIYDRSKFQLGFAPMQCSSL